MNWTNNTGYITTFNKDARKSDYYVFLHEQCREYFGRLIGNLTTLSKIMQVDFTSVTRYCRSHGVYFQVMKHRYISEVLFGNAKSPHFYWMMMISGGVGIEMEVLLLNCDKFEERVRSLIVDRGGKEWLFPHEMGVGLVRVFAMGFVKDGRSVEVFRCGVVVVDCTHADYYRSVKGGRVEDAVWSGRKVKGSQVFASGMNGRGEWVLIVGWNAQETKRRIERGLYVPTEDHKAMHQQLFVQRMQEGFKDKVDVVKVEGAKRWGVERYEALKQTDNGLWLGYMAMEVGMSPDIEGKSGVMSKKEALLRKRDMKRVRAMAGEVGLGLGEGLIGGDGGAVDGSVMGIKARNEAKISKAQHSMTEVKKVKLVVPKKRMDD